MSVLNSNYCESRKSIKNISCSTLLFLITFLLLLSGSAGTVAGNNSSYFMYWDWLTRWNSNLSNDSTKFILGRTLVAAPFFFRLIRQTRGQRGLTRDDFLKILLNLVTLSAPPSLPVLIFTVDSNCWLLAPDFKPRIKIWSTRTIFFISEILNIDCSPRETFKLENILLICHNIRVNTGGDRVV